MGETTTRRDALTLFVMFVRLNPQLAPDDPVMERVFDAYMTTDDDALAEPQP
jgi:hypothetical protein